jgi:hypothetical protein
VGTLPRRLDAANGKILRRVGVETNAWFPAALSEGQNISPDPTARQAVVLPSVTDVAPPSSSHFGDPARIASLYAFNPNRLANAMPAPPSARPPVPAENTSTSVIRSQKALSGPEKVAAIAQVNDLEGVLFDGEGHVQRHTNPERANELLGAINKLRRQLGWLGLDMTHHQCWSDDVPAGPGR